MIVFIKENIVLDVYLQYEMLKPIYTTDHLGHFLCMEKTKVCTCKRIELPPLGLAGALVPRVREPGMWPIYRQALGSL